jgi:hypothetical protein
MLQSKSDLVSDEFRSRQFEERRKLAELMFPLPPELQGNSPNPFEN